jgi:hypothetical protein
METSKGRRWDAVIFEGEKGRGQDNSVVLEANNTVKSSQQSGRPKAAADVWRSKMTKGT